MMYVIPVKLSECTGIIIGWLCLSCSKVLCAAAFNFAVLKLAEIHTLALLAYGPCFWKICAKDSSKCAFQSYIPPEQWVPCSLIIQLVNVVALSTMNSHLFEKIKTYKQKDKIPSVHVQYWWPRFRVQPFALQGLLIASCCFLTLWTLIVMGMTMVGIFAPKRHFMTPFSVAFVILLFLLKILNTGIIAIVQFFPRDPVPVSKLTVQKTALCSAAIVLELVVFLVDWVLFISYLIQFDLPTNSYFKHPSAPCQFAYIGTIGAMYELYMIWALWRLLQRFKAMKFLNGAENLPRILFSHIEMDGKNVIGSGQFGTVNAATNTLTKKQMAVKVINSQKSIDQKELAMEAIYMSRCVNCKYIVKLLGISIDHRPVLLCMEFCNGGSLKSYLQKDEVKKKLAKKHLLRMSKHIATACDYLERIGIIHRDIALRNCLVVLDKQGKPVKSKLGDFGLAKDVGSCKKHAYKCRYLKTHKFYTAPESLKTGFFTPASDVWSFGILLWEILSWGANPYSSLYNPSVCSSPEKFEQIVIQHLCQNKSLLDLHDPQPNSFCSSTKEIMAKCFKFPEEILSPLSQPSIDSPSIPDRPHFKEILSEITELIKTAVKSTGAEVQSHAVHQPSQVRNEISNLSIICQEVHVTVEEPVLKPHYC